MNRARKRRRWGGLVAACLLAVSEVGPASPGPCASETHPFLERRRADYVVAVARSREWLDALDVDPIELRTRGIKGKKKLVEQLDGYYRLWQVAEPADRVALMRRIREVVAVTYEARYHDMGGLDDDEFREDATSYLRAAVLMDRLGLDTRLYREEIRRAHPRLNAHMRGRGPHQRVAFHWYYRHFGLEEPFPLARSLERGFIARRADPDALSVMDAYHLTHEVFVPFEYGERLDARPFDEADLDYLRPALERLVDQHIGRDDPDLVAELVSCLRFVGFVESPAYRRGLVFLLESQNPDGSFGDVEASTRREGPWGLHHYILHTTVVAIDALTIAFHEPWNREVFAGCRPDHSASRRSTPVLDPATAR